MIKQKIKEILKNKIPHPLMNAYYIGFLKEAEVALPIVERYSKISWLDVRPYESEGWFADPFILSVNDNIIELLAEEMIYKTGRGVLVHMMVEMESCKILEKNIILELDTHLSFPIYIKENGKLYVYPENYQSGSLKIYEYDYSLKRLVNPRTIIEAPLLDTQIIEFEGSYYAFGVIYRTGLQKDTQKLFVYKADSLFGDYRLIQVIDNPRCEERGAGLIYEERNRLIRPAQCCEGGYGKEVILYELQYCCSSFNEIETIRIIPDRNAENGNVLHTYNKMNGWVTIDGWHYKYPFLAYLYKKIRRIDIE